MKISFSLKPKTPKDYTDKELLAMLAKNKGNKSQTAWMNGFSLSALYNRLNKMKVAI